MRAMDVLTGLVVGASRFGDHLLSRKVSGIVVAALAFLCGAGLAHALKHEPQALPAAPTFTSCGAPELAEVTVRDTPADAVEEKEPVFAGRYRNQGYGYSVEIPDGMVGVGQMSPAPQHGFDIDLDNPRSTARACAKFSKSSVFVDGSGNALEWQRLDDAVNSHLSFLREEGRGVRVQAREKTRLGGLPAVRLIAFYEEGGVRMVSDRIVAFRREAGDAPEIVYTLSLSTPRSKYERDRAVLEALRDGWCLQPVE